MATTTDHICKNGPVFKGQEPTRIWIVNRELEVTQDKCAGCSQIFDREDGAREYTIWAQGYVAGKRDVCRAAGATPEPGLTGWNDPVIRL